MKKLSIIFCLLLSSLVASAQMNNPYVDDKLLHFGFSLGVNFMGYSVTDSNVPIQGETYHARTNSMLPGFTVGFVSDLRLSRHLNLRFLPNLSFGQKTIEYSNESHHPILGRDSSNTTILNLPLALPLVLKWSAEREKNYRPYLVAGGGVAFDFARDTERMIYQQLIDYFVTFGFGCDFYMQWFKFCPEIRYQVGFKNALTPVEGRQLPPADHFYTNAISRLRNQQITLIFNFE